MVFQHKARKGLSHDEAHVQRLAGMLPRRPTGTLQDNDVVRMREHKVAGALKGDDAFRDGDLDLLLDTH